MSIRTVNQERFGVPVEPKPACTTCKDELLKEFPGVDKASRCDIPAARCTELKIDEKIGSHMSCGVRPFNVR